VDFFTQSPEGYLRDLEYARLIYTLKNLRIVNELPRNTEDMILCFDEEDPSVLSKKWKKKIFINQDISLNRSGHEKALIIPYPMHPVIYKLKRHEKLAKFRDNKRMLRIFFSGMYGPDYQHSMLPDQFNKISRPRAVEAIIDSGIASVIKSRHDIDESLKGEYKNMFIFINTEKTVIFQEHWLDTISRSDFFLALPGDVRPMSHNIIEAMAVGTIPITNYPEWFHPRLRHMENCIVFNSEEDLIQKIKSVLEMDPEKIKKMRQEVIKCYEKHMSPSSFVKLIESSDEDNIEVFFNSGNREYLSKLNKDSVIISRQEEKDE